MFRPVGLTLRAHLRSARRSHSYNSNVARTITGKVIIITGASSGIGRAAAVALGRESAKLVLVARREDRLRQLEREIHGDTLVLSFDLRDKAQVKQMMEQTINRYGRIDVLINNAGFGFQGSVENTPAEVVREIFELNFDAALVACQLAIPIMRKQGGGHIINVSSVVGRRALPLSGIYCATKFALNGISEALRIEVKDSNIDVSIVSPAATESEFGEHVRHSGVKARFKAVGRTQTSEEVAAAIVRCIKNPKIEVFPNRASRLLAWANALAPSLVDRIMMRFLRARVEALSDVKR
jgi:short-subunit dehydrogenase